PSTPEGKAASSQNAFKSGLYSDQPYIPGESKEDFAKLQDDYAREFRPTTVVERFLVDKLIRNEWLLRRFARIEDQIVSAQFRNAETVLMGSEIGQMFQMHSTIYMRLERRMRNAEKAYKEAMHELIKLRQTTPQKTTPNPQPSESGSFRQAEAKVNAFIQDMESQLAEHHRLMRQERQNTPAQEAK